MSGSPPPSRSQAAAAAEASLEAIIAAKGPPYPPLTAALGGTPSPIPDIPLSAVFLVLFASAAAANMFIFVTNNKKGHKFLFSMAMFAFCTVRVLATSFRMVWSKNQTNIGIAIAAQLFVTAGVVILFVINLFLTSRIVRARLPHIGWSKPFSFLIPWFALIVVLIALVMLVSVLVYNFFTLSPTVHRIARDMTLYATTMFALLAFLPIPITVATLLTPRRTYIDKFGSGRFRSKVIILLIGSSLLTTGAAFRAGTNWMTPVPRTEHPWYFSKACFYTFDFTIEITFILFYVFARIDQRFHIPNKAEASEGYSRRSNPQEKEGESKEIDMENEAESSEDARQPASPQAGASTAQADGATGDMPMMQIDPRNGDWKIKSLPNSSSQAPVL